MLHFRNNFQRIHYLFKKKYLNAMQAYLSKESWKIIETIYKIQRLNDNEISITMVTPSLSSQSSMLYLPPEGVDTALLKLWPISWITCNEGPPLQLIQELYVHLINTS